MGARSQIKTARPRRFPISARCEDQARQASRHHFTHYIPNYRITLGLQKPRSDFASGDDIVAQRLAAIKFRELGVRRLPSDFSASGNSADR
jgi:hypothetical protein